MGIRVAYIVDHLGKGGAQNRIRSIIPMLPKSWDVYVFTLHGPVDDWSNLRQRDYKVESLAKFKTDPRIWLAPYKKIWKSCDVVHSHLFYSFIMGCLIKRKHPEIKFIAHINHMRQSAPFGVYRAYAKLQNYCDRFIAINISVKKDLEDAGIDSSKIEIGTIAVDKNRIACENLIARNNIGFNIKEDDFVLIRVARLSAVKSHEYFLRVFALIAKELPTAIYLLAGDGPLRKKLERDVKAMNIEDRVFFLGYTDNIAGLNAAADLAFVRGYGTAAVEHMAAGIPVCSIDSDGIRDIVKHQENGIVFGWDQEKQMADAICRLLKDKNHLRSMKEKAAKTIQDYWDKKYCFLAEKKIWEALYKDIMV